MSTFIECLELIIFLFTFQVQVPTTRLAKCPSTRDQQHVWRYTETKENGEAADLYLKDCQAIAFERFDFEDESLRHVSQPLSKKDQTYLRENAYKFNGKYNP